MRLPWWSLVVLLLTACGLAAACGRPATPEPQPSPDGSAESGEAGTPEKVVIKGRDGALYDQEGVPVPDGKRLALGTAIPVGFERVHQGDGRVTYRGPYLPEKVVTFYRRYLIVTHVEERRNGVWFPRAVPRPPGDESRTVDVSVIPIGHIHSQVVIEDRTAQPAKGGGEEITQEYFDDLAAKAHKGSGAVKAPIPGTY